MLVRKLELALEQLSSVASAAIVAVSDSTYFEVGAACVVPKTGRAPTARDVREHLRAHLANYEVPKFVEICASLPALPIGKLDKHAPAAEAVAIWNRRERHRLDSTGPLLWRSRLGAPAQRLMLPAFLVVRMALRPPPAQIIQPPPA